MKICGRKGGASYGRRRVKEVDLGSGSQGPRPISISASLIEKEKLELILLLKEFKDVFT